MPLCQITSLFEDIIKNLAYSIYSAFILLLILIATASVLAAGYYSQLDQEINKT